MGNDNDILHASREQIDQIQLAGIQKTVIDVYEHIPFYKKSFDEAGFDPYSVKSLDDVARIPFVQKQDLRDAYPYGMLAVPLKDVREIHMSSGTTGIATMGAYTEHDIKIWGECFSRAVDYAHGDENDVMQICYGYGLFTGGLGAHYGSISAGCATIPISAGNTERQIRILREMGPTILACTPSYAMHIADTAIEMGLDPARDFNLRAGIHGAEPFSDNFRRDLERKLGYRVLDIYGLTEVYGPGIGISCDAHDGMHIWDDFVYIEIVDPETGEVLPDGQEGELVLTTLRKQGAPLIRYRTHDLTRIVPGTCACGSRHPRIATLTGRTDDMFKVKGCNMFPAQVEEVIKATDGTSSEYQVMIEAVDGHDVLTVLFETPLEGEALARCEEELALIFKAKLGCTPEAKGVPLGELPRSEKKTKRIFDSRY